MSILRGIKSLDPENTDHRRIIAQFQDDPRLPSFRGKTEMFNLVDLPLDHPDRKRGLTLFQCSKCGQWFVKMQLRCFTGCMGKQVY